ncbi:8137_t:CDS:1, partial [Racocetra persica]
QKTLCPISSSFTFLDLQKLFNSQQTFSIIDTTALRKACWDQKHDNKFR